MRNRICAREKVLGRNNPNAFRRLEEIYAKIRSSNESSIIVLVDSRDYMDIKEFLKKDGYTINRLDTLSSENEIVIGW